MSILGASSFSSIAAISPVIRSVWTTILGSVQAGSIWMSMRTYLPPFRIQYRDLGGYHATFLVQSVATVVQPADMENRPAESCLQPGDLRLFVLLCDFCYRSSPPRTSSSSGLRFQAVITPVPSPVRCQLTSSNDRSDRPALQLAAVHGRALRARVHPAAQRVHRCGPARRSQHQLAAGLEHAKRLA